MAGSATRPAVELIRTIEPPPPASITGRTCLAQRNVPVRLTASVRCQSSSEVSDDRPGYQDARAREQDVDPADAMPGRLPRPAPHARVGGDIDLGWDERPRPDSRRPVSRALEARAVEVRDRDGAPSSAERRAVAHADRARAPGDRGDLAVGAGPRSSSIRCEHGMLAIPPERGQPRRVAGLERAPTRLGSVSESARRRPSRSARPSAGCSSGSTSRSSARRRRSTRWWPRGTGWRRRRGRRRDDARSGFPATRLAPGAPPPGDDAPIQTLCASRRRASRSSSTWSPAAASPRSWSMAASCSRRPAMGRAMGLVPDGAVRRPGPRCRVHVRRGGRAAAGDDAAARHPRDGPRPPLAGVDADDDRDRSRAGLAVRGPGRPALRADG